MPYRVEFAAFYEITEVDLDALRAQLVLGDYVGGGYSFSYPEWDRYYRFADACVIDVVIVARRDVRSHDYGYLRDAARRQRSMCIDLRAVLNAPEAKFTFYTFHARAYVDAWRRRRKKAVLFRG